MRIVLFTLGVALALAGCTNNEMPVETHSEMGAEESSVADSAVAVETVPFTPVEPVHCESEASTASDPAERRADEKTEDAWTAC